MVLERDHFHSEHSMNNILDSTGYSEPSLSIFTLSESVTVAECAQVVMDLQTIPVFNTLSQNTFSQDMDHSPREHEAQARPTTRTFPVFNPAGSD